MQADEAAGGGGDEPEEGKGTVVRRYWKEKGRNGRKTVWFCEMTAGAVVRGPTDTGYSRYPIAFMPWEKVKNQYHGQAAITGMIPNQIFVNKLFAMAMQHVKQLAFPKVIYNRNLMAGRKWNNRVGEAIGVNGDPNVAVATGFRAPDMSAQVLVMIDKVIEYTRDTMGASDAALGNVTPDNTSAIIAVQKATSMPLELQRQDFYCFVEDSVRIWMDMMAQNYGVRMVRMKAPEAEAEAVPALPDSMGAGMLPQAAGGAPGMAGAMLQQAAPGPASGIPVLRSKMEPNGDKGRGKDKERLGITNADRLQFDRESLERLANYLTKYTNRKRRWRQSRGLEKPQRPRPNDGKYTRRQLERLVTSGAVFDSEFWRRKYQGWEINDITPIQNDVTKEWSIYLKLRRTVPRRKSAVFAKLRKS